MEEQQLVDSLSLEEALSFYCPTVDFIATSVIPEQWKPTNQSCRNWSGKASSTRHLTGQVTCPAVPSCLLPESHKNSTSHSSCVVRGESPIKAHPRRMAWHTAATWRVLPLFHPITFSSGVLSGTGGGTKFPKHFQQFLHIFKMVLL